VLTGRHDTFAYTLDDAGLVTSAIEHRVPSGFAPGFDPPFTYQYPNPQSLTSVLKSAPLDEPYVEVASPDATAPKGQRVTQSGGGTPQPGGTAYRVEVGRPGGAAVVVGAPDTPVPDPVCIPRAAAPQDAADARLWSTGSRMFDARVDAFAAFGQAARTATGWILDGFNRPLEMHDAHGVTWHATFDQEDRPLSALDAAGEGAVVTYDQVGNVTRIEERPSGAVTTFAYDERDSLSSVRWPSGGVARYEYDDRSDLSRATFEPSDGSQAEVAEYAFDAFHRVRRVVQFTNWPDKVGSVETDFGYDNNGGCAAYLQGVSTETT
jgi:YD repeat-containing protein